MFAFTQVITVGLPALFFALAALVAVFFIVHTVVNSAREEVQGLDTITTGIARVNGALWLPIHACGKRASGI